MHFRSFQVGALGSSLLAFGAFFCVWGALRGSLRGETGPPKSYMWTVPPSTDRRALQIAEYSDRTFRWTVFQSTWEIMMNSYGVTTTYDQFQQIINR